MHHHLDLLSRKIEQPPRLDDLAALFIIVAESIVICAPFAKSGGPGRRRQSLWQSARRSTRNGPPLAVNTTRATSRDLPACNA
ncbi:MAG: hypothetical protein R3C56_18790 [Pirellulaceae bacterium]